MQNSDLMSTRVIFGILILLYVNPTRLEQADIKASLGLFAVFKPVVNKKK